MYYLILHIINTPAPPSRNNPVAPLLHIINTYVDLYVCQVSSLSAFQLLQGYHFFLPLSSFLSLSVSPILPSSFLSALTLSLVFCFSSKNCELAFPVVVASDSQITKLILFPLRFTFSSKHSFDMLLAVWEATPLPRGLELFIVVLFFSDSFNLNN